MIDDREVRDMIDGREVRNIATHKTDISVGSACQQCQERNYIS